MQNNSSDFVNPDTPEETVSQQTPQAPAQQTTPQQPYVQQPYGWSSSQQPYGQQPYGQQMPYGQPPYAQQPYAQPAPRKPMEKFPIEKRDFRMALCAILWTYLMFVLTWENLLNAGYMIAYLTGIILFSVYFYRPGTTVLKPFETVCGLLATAAGPVFAFTNHGVKVLVALLGFVCCVIWFASLCGKEEGKGDAALIPHVCGSFFTNAFGAIGRSMGSLFSGGNGDKQRRSWLLKALIGLAVSLPIAGILLLLLTAADEAFSDLVKNIVDFVGEQILRILLALIHAPFVIAFALGLKKKAAKEKTEHEGGLEYPYVGAFLGLVSVIYLLYLFSQLGYFFNGFAGILPKGFTLSEYAVHGFYEMCVIAAINFVMVFLVLLFTKKREGKLPGLVQWESTFICLFTLVLIATVFSKMILYVRFYALTQSRILVIAFMLFMAIVFIALILRLFFHRVRVLRVAVVAAMCVLLLLGFGRPEYISSRYNVWAYQSGKTAWLDMDTLDYNGACGTVAIHDVATNPDPVFDTYREEAKSILRRKANSKFYLDQDGSVQPRSRSKWAEWNYSESRENEILKQYVTSRGAGYYDYY